MPYHFCFFYFPPTEVATCSHRLPLFYNVDVTPLDRMGTMFSDLYGLNYLQKESRTFSLSSKNLVHHLS